MAESPDGGARSRNRIDDAGVGALLGSMITTSEPTTVVVVVERMRRRTLRALGYGASLQPRVLSGVHVAVDGRAAAKLTRQWDRRCPEMILQQLEPSAGGVAATIRKLAVDEVADGKTFVVIVPERYRSLRAAFGLAEPSLEIVEALEDVPNAWAILLPV
jgi:hypothetical protein